jgi:hypothetical protein
MKLKSFLPPVGVRRIWLRCTIIANVVLLVACIVFLGQIDRRSDFGNLVIFTSIYGWLLFFVSLLFSFPKDGKLLTVGWLIFLAEGLFLAQPAT